jgi:UPF0755 protein
VIRSEQLLKLLGGFLAAILVLSGIFFYYLIYQFPVYPLNPTNTSVVVTLPKGSGPQHLIKQLQTQKVMTPSQGQLFYLWLRWKKYDKSLKAGEYAIALNNSPNIIAQKLLRGDVIQYAFTLVEGITFQEALRYIQRHPAIKKTLVNASPQTIMTLLGEPNLPCEGLFFPDTYYFPRDFSDVDLLKRARNAMQVKLAAAWQKRSPHSNIKTPYEALIIASIIEKETASDKERAIISCVLQRRIAINMRLQVDPSVIYGLGQDFKGRLTSAQLKQDTPYNTYLHKGIPPTPIALPGLKSLEAALHPQEGTELFFVAKGDGTHQFSTTLKEHNAAVMKYQQGEHVLP